MTMNLDEFEKYMAATRLQREKERYRLADIDTNGSEEHFQAWSHEIDNHSIGKLGTKGLVGCCF